MKIDKKKISIQEISDITLNLYMELLSIVKKNMLHPEWLGDFTIEEYQKIIKVGKIYGWFYENKLIAAGVLLPSNKKSLVKLLSSDLNEDEVIDFGPEMVHPNYVGNGLQIDILNYLENISIKQGYEYALGTIHCDNIYSINNLKKVCFDYIGSVSLKRGSRNIYRKKLGK